MDLISCRLKNPIRTPISYKIIRRAEKQLMYEGVRGINNTLTMFKIKRDTCRNKLAVLLHLVQDLFRECLDFMEKNKYVRHIKTLTRHLNKFTRLQHKHFCGIHSNHNSHTQCVRPLTDSDNINNNNNNRDINHRGHNDNNSTDDSSSKWIVNISSSPLQKCILLSWPGDLN